MDSKPIQCGFESAPGALFLGFQGRHRAADVPVLVEHPLFVAHGRDRSRKVTTCTTWAHAASSGTCRSGAQPELREQGDRGLQVGDPLLAIARRPVTAHAAHDHAQDAGPATEPPSNTAAYSYLLGLYLGDGCISPGTRAGSRSPHRMRRHLARPDRSLRGRRRSQSTPATKSTGSDASDTSTVVGTSQHWPCLFPQHGPGKKHERQIALEPWQQEIVDAHPWDFIRGLIHSDGCRITNWTDKVVAGERKRYEYPRLLLHQHLRRHPAALHRHARPTSASSGRTAHADGNPFNISVARKASVALMDAARRSQVLSRRAARPAVGRRRSPDSRCCRAAPSTASPMWWTRTRLVEPGTPGGSRR